VLARVVDESCFVSVQSRIYAEGEELAIERTVYLLLELVFVFWRIHIEQVAASNLRIVIRSSDICSLTRDDFAYILADEGSRLDVLHCEEPPHRQRYSALLDIASFVLQLDDVLFREFTDAELPFVNIGSIKYLIRAVLLVAPAAAVALVEHILACVLPVRPRLDLDNLLFDD